MLFTVRNTHEAFIVIADNWTGGSDNAAGCGLLPA
jgi:hypothetical protein